MGVSYKMIAYGESLLELIPQREPIVMIDALAFVDDKSARTELTVRSDNIFFRDGVLHEPGLIENIAQSAAVRLGWIYKSRNMQTPLGFIGALTDLKVHFLPALNSKLITEITIEHEILEASIISGMVFCGGNIIAECKMKIFIMK